MLYDIKIFVFAFSDMFKELDGGLKLTKKMGSKLLEVHELDFKKLSAHFSPNKKVQLEK